MQVLARALRTAFVAVVLVGLAVAPAILVSPTILAGSSGQPGDVDVGTDPGAPTTWWAGSSGQPGDVDVG